MSDSEIQWCTWPSGVHNYVNGRCTRCGDKTPQLRAELADAFVQEAKALGLTGVDGPDGQDTVLFNLNEMERGCILVNRNGTYKGAGDRWTWGEMSLADAAELMDFLAAPAS